jgi:RNA polymerase sigma-70 factor (ECF subfamily)
MLEDERRRLFAQLLSEDVHESAWRFAARQCRTREDSEDLLQESLASAYRKLHQLRDRAAFRGWLFSIIRRRYLSGIKRSTPDFCESLWYQAALSAQSENSLSDSIAEAMAQLPEPQRELLALFYIDGLSLNECGRVLGIAPQVVGQRLYRARRSLRRVLEGQHALGRWPRSNSHESV